MLGEEVSLARSFWKLKLNFSPVAPPGGGLLAQVLLWVKQGQGPAQPSPTWQRG